jgi:hypothetical protein
MVQPQHQIYTKRPFGNKMQTTFSQFFFCLKLIFFDIFKLFWCDDINNDF